MNSDAFLSEKIRKTNKKPLHGIKPKKPKVKIVEILMPYAVFDYIRKSKSLQEKWIDFKSEPVSIYLEAKSSS